jgi:hypothetical protein
MVFLEFGGDDDAVYTTEIKDQRSSRYRERDQKAVVHSISHLFAIDFVLLVETYLQNIVLLFYKQSIYVGPLQASVLFP